jgi:hypothetical protein
MNFKYSKNKIFIQIGLFILIFFLGIIVRELSLKFCNNQTSGFSKMGSSPILYKDKISTGYTLLTTLGVYKGNSKEKGRISLVDLYGKPVHTWFTNYQPFDSKLLKNGDLLVMTWPSEENKNQQIKIEASIIQLDWKSNVIWQYKNDLLHHDFEVLPNGNIAALVYDQVPAEVASKVKGGILRPEAENKVISDSIIEINKNGETVWKWDLFKILDTSQEVIGELDLHSEWTHSNSIRYIQSNPVDNKPAYLISVRNLNFVAIISRETGAVLWRSPKGMLDHQHDATFLENGNILVFDNGYTEHAKEYGLLESKIKEINPKTNKVIWQFGGSDYSEKLHLYSPTFGGAQKLRNGNILISLGIDGEIMEVTRDKEIVWDLINPYQTVNKIPGTNFFNNYLYRSKRIYQDEIEWPEKIGDPDPAIAAYCN